MDGWMDGWMYVCGSWASAVRFWGHNDFGEGALGSGNLQTLFYPCCVAKALQFIQINPRCSQKPQLEFQIMDSVISK